MHNFSSTIVRKGSAKF